MNPILGEIRLLPFNFVPSGWLACEGQQLPISSNQALFSLLGTVFGGDGTTVFGLPDLRGRSPLTPSEGATIVGYCIAVDGVYPSRD